MKCCNLWYKVIKARKKKNEIFYNFQRGFVCVNNIKKVPSIDSGKLMRAK